METPICNSCQFKKTSLFNCCTTAEIDTITENKDFKNFKKGQELFYQGGHPMGVFCVFSGQIKLSKMGTDGKEKVIRLVKAGDTLGYRSLLENAKYSASATALEDAQACFVSKNDLIKLLETNPKVSLDLMKMLAKALGDTQEKLIRLGQKPLKELVAETLLLLQNTHTEENEGNTYIISREALAKIIKMPKEVIERQLVDFEKEKILTLHDNGITILNSEPLLEIISYYD